MSDAVARSVKLFRLHALVSSGCLQIASHDFSIDTTKSAVKVTIIVRSNILLLVNLHDLDFTREINLQNYFSLRVLIQLILEFESVVVFIIKNAL